MPKLSIITINYNNLEGLQKTFESVFEQTYQEFEYIVIDGDSTDGSKELIAQNKDKITYWVSEPDKGIYNAMNKGIKVANGEYLLFLNSGDIFYKESSIYKANHHLTTQNKDLYIFDICLDENNQKIIHQYPSHYTFNYFRRGSLGHPSTFIRRELFYKFGFYNEENKIVSDWEFFLLLWINNCTYCKINEVLSVFSMDGISTLNKEVAIAEMESVLNNKYNFIFQDIINFEKKIHFLEKDLSYLNSNIWVRVLRRLKLL